MLHGPRIDDDAWVHDVRIAEDETGIDLTVTIGPDERPDVPIAEAKQDLYSRLGARPDVMVRVHLDQPPISRVVARAAEVPGFGWRRFTPAPLEHPVTVTEDGGLVRLDNGLVQVVVDPSDGTFAVGGLAGFGRLVDGGDLGDSYNYSPPGKDSLVEQPESVSLSVTERGPVRAKATVTATYRWPDKVDGGTQRRVGEHLVTVTTVIELRADERPVRVETTFVNPAKDHRLRVHLPLPAPARTSVAECAFGTVERGLSAEGRPDEFGLPTFPSRRFVSAGGLTVFHEGLHEYELVDVDDGPDGAGARSLALTLLRATGMLSRLGMAYRPFPAGPLTPVDGLQLVGRTITARYALAVGDVDPWALVDDIWLPLEVTSSLGGGDRPAVGSGLNVSGAVVSSLRRSAGSLELRVFNPGGEPATVELGGRSGWLVDLRGEPLGAVAGSFGIGPFAFTTVRLAGA
jgi:hypothetical protein